MGMLDTRQGGLPPSNQFPLTATLEMNTLDPSMMLSPYAHDDTTGIFHPFIE